MAGATEIDASWRNSHADGHYSSRMRTMAWILVLILLFGTGVIGITNGIRELGDSHSGLQLTVTIAVMLYGVFGVAAGIGLARRRPWSVTLSKIWAVAIHAEVGLGDNPTGALGPCVAECAPDSF